MPKTEPCKITVAPICSTTSTLIGTPPFDEETTRSSGLTPTSISSPAFVLETSTAKSKFKSPIFATSFLFLISVSVVLRKFIFGWPIKPATNFVLGL